MYDAEFPVIYTMVHAGVSKNQRLNTGPIILRSFFWGLPTRGP